MKKFLKILLGLIIVIALVAIGGIIYINSSFPDVKPAQDISVKIDSTTIARGEYLVKHVSVCFDCHSESDWTRLSSPSVESTLGAGGEAYTEEMGFPGNYYAANITPHGLKDWTDGEIFRAITVGVDKEGEPLFPLMPYKAYSYLAPEDAEAIVAYLRSLEPIENDIPESEASFPFSLILRTLPTEAKPTDLSTITDSLKRGEYLSKIAGCVFCHTPTVDNVPDMKMMFAGGEEFGMPLGGIVRAANITPDNDTGIGDWDVDLFVETFKSFEDPATLPATAPGTFNTLMPWTEYAGMTEEDLRAIYYYLRSVKPIKSSVERFTPPAKEK